MSIRIVIDTNVLVGALIGQEYGAKRLKELAKSRNISVNKLLEELTTMALTEYDLETRFKLRASRGSTEKALEVLDQLKQDFVDSE